MAQDLGTGHEPRANCQRLARHDRAVSETHPREMVVVTTSRPSTTPGTTPDAARGQLLGLSVGQGRGRCD